MRAVLNIESAEQQLKRDGFVVIPGLFTDEVLKRVGTFYEGLGIATGKEFFLSNFLDDVHVRRKIHQFLGEEMKPVTDGVLNSFKYVLGTLAIKPAGGSSSFSLHQDWSLVDERKFMSLSVWVPLVDVDSTNGCFRLLKNSCKEFGFPRGMNIPFPYEQYSNYISEKYMTPIAMKRGDALIFDHRLVHDSGPNNSNDIRIAAVMAFVPSEAPIMHYYHPIDSDAIDLYRLPDDFLVANNFFNYKQPPVNGILVEHLNFSNPGINQDTFEKNHHVFLEKAEG